MHHSLAMGTWKQDMRADPIFVFQAVLHRRLLH